MEVGGEEEGTLPWHRPLSLQPRRNRLAEVRCTSLLQLIGAREAEGMAEGVPGTHWGGVGEHVKTGTGRKR